jgi:hypothetical protein
MTKSYHHNHNNPKFKPGQKVKFVVTETCNEISTDVKMKGVIVEYVGDGDYLVESNGEYHEIAQSELR